MSYIDIEDALQARLNESGFSAHAKPLPASFEMPCVTVDMLNAWDDNAAQAVYSVDFDCRAAGYAEAAQLQLGVSDALRALPGTDLGGKPCYSIENLRLQRAQPDASHETAILATVSAELRVRVVD